MAGNGTKDMTTGSPLKLILGFAVPLLFGLLFQQFYSMVDTIIVGKYLGMDALAGVGSTGSINFMIIGFCMGVCSGFSIPVAQSLGAGDERALRKYVANSVWLSIVFAVVMTIVVSLLCRKILVWMRTPENILDLAYEYIQTIFLGIPAIYLYNLLSGVIRSLGNSKTPVAFLIMSAVLNVLLDLFTILVLKMGVGGTAIATVLSQLISGICCLIFMIKKYPILHIQKEEWKVDSHFMKNLCNMGIPMGLQYSITAIGSVILQTAVNSLGAVAVAAVTAAGKISNFSACPFDALGSTMTTFTGQNVGAKNLDRVKNGVKTAALIGSVYAVAVYIVLFFFGENIATLFVDPSEANVPELLSRVGQFLRINTLFYIPLCFVNVVRFAIQGMGFSRLAIFAGISEMIGRSFVGFVIVPAVGFAGICYASPVAWILADLFLIPAFLHCLKTLNQWFYGKKKNNGEAQNSDRI